MPVNLEDTVIPENVIQSAKNSADIWDMPIYVGRVRETAYNARGDQFIARKTSEGLGVYYVALPDTWIGRGPDQPWYAR